MSDADWSQPGHEYTKANVKFCLAVSQSEPIKRLEAFAEANQETQGKFTIGDEKVGLFLVGNVEGRLIWMFVLASQCVHARQCKSPALDGWRWGLTSSRTPRSSRRPERRTRLR